MANPAETLYGHFNAILGLDVTQVTWQQAWRSTTGHAWADSVGPLMGQIARIDRIVASHPTVDPGPVFHHRPTWVKAILLYDVNSGAAMANSGFILDETSTFSLYTLAKLIEQMPETTPEIPAGQLQDLVGSVAVLRADIEAADDLPRDLRTFLLDLVIQMQDRLSRVLITGTGPVEDLIAETIGSGAVKPTMWRRAMDTPLRNKIVNLFVALQAIVGTIDTASATIESAADRINGAVTVIEQIFDQPKQIESGSEPKLIESGKAAGGEHETNGN